MKIVLFGCRKITNDIIDFLVKSTNHSIELVVTQDEERDRVYHKQLVKEICDYYKINTTRFDGKIDPAIIGRAKPDLIFSLYYRKIIPQSVLDIPKIGAINIHPAILPKLRGPAPSLWNSLNGDKYAGSTMHHLDINVDAGDIIDQEVMEIGDRTGFELNRDLMEIGTDLFNRNLDKIIDGTANRVPQKHEDATYCLPFRNNLCYMIWDDPYRAIRQVKTFAPPYDSAIAWTERGCKIYVLEANILDKRTSFRPPGFFEKNGDNIIVQTCTIPILITKWKQIDGVLPTSGRFISGCYV